MQQGSKIRKKDGSLKSPYQAILQFEQVQKLFNELKSNPKIDHVYLDNKSYGTKLWGSTKKNMPYDDVIDIFKKYFPEFKMDEGYAWQGNYHGSWLGIDLYIAYTTFDNTPNSGGFIAKGNGKTSAPIAITITKEAYKENVDNQHAFVELFCNQVEQMGLGSLIDVPALRAVNKEKYERFKQIPGMEDKPKKNDEKKEQSQVTPEPADDPDFLEVL